MSIVLGANQYGKAENRVVRIYRDTPRHEIRDVNVSSALRGDFTAAHTVGDQSRVLPTDSQKQTAFAFAKSHGIDQPETYALALARHYVDEIEPVTGARIECEEFAWERVGDNDHTWVRAGREVRRTVVTVDGKGPGGSTHVVSGFRDLSILKSTGSQFRGFLEDEYTILEPTGDRVMATSLVAWWRYSRALDPAAVPYGDLYRDVKRIMVTTFAELESLALQQTLFAMGSNALEAHPEIVEVKLSAPNLHHWVYDLAPFGLENRNEVFYADDRPYGLIQVTAARDDAEDPGRAWDAGPTSGYTW
ncbi:MAG: factor-independent urate hydroxylase [Thermoleophilia bacterium]